MKKNNVLAISSLLFLFGTACASQATQPTDTSASSFYSEIKRTVQLPQILIDPAAYKYISLGKALTHEIIIHGFVQYADFLCSVKYINMDTKHHNTPLHYACNHADENSAQLFVSAILKNPQFDASTIHKKGSLNKTPLELAREQADKARGSAAEIRQETVKMLCDFAGHLEQHQCADQSLTPLPVPYRAASSTIGDDHEIEDSSIADCPLSDDGPIAECPFDSEKQTTADQSDTSEAPPAPVIPPLLSLPNRINDETTVNYVHRLMTTIRGLEHCEQPIPGSRFRSFLTHSVIRYRDEHAQEYLQTASYINKVDQRGDLPLHTACRYVNQFAARMYVRAILSNPLFDPHTIDSQNSKGETPLGVAEAMLQKEPSNARSAIVQLLRERKTQTS